MSAITVAFTFIMIVARELRSLRAATHRIGERHTPD